MSAATSCPSVVEPVPPLPPYLLPSLASLPRPFHADLISMMARSDRVRMASVSPALRALYASTLDCLRLRSSEGRRVSALASLLRKQRKILLLEVWPMALSAFLVVLAQGCLSNVQVMVLILPVQEEDFVDIALIAHAMSTQGALQALERLSLVFMWQPGHNGVRSLPTISAALGVQGVAPVLRELDLDYWPLDDEDMKALAAMIENRARQPNCKGLEILEAGDWLEEGFEAARVRLLRALLPSITRLDDYTWQPAYGACVLEAQPAHLAYFAVKLRDDAPPSVEVLEAMPALEEVVYYPAERDGFNGYPALEPFVSALHRGVALQKLNALTLALFHFGVAGWGHLLGALAGAACATQMIRLEFVKGDFNAQNMASLAALLGQDTFPALTTLRLFDNPAITDDGVVVLAEGLGAASTTRLAELDLSYVRLGDKGMTTLAKLVSTNRLKDLEVLLLNGNWDITDAGACALARAIDEAGSTGLPRLLQFRAERLSHVTDRGVGAMAFATLKNCPCLQDFYMPGRDDELSSEDMVEGMAYAAGRDDVRVCVSLAGLRIFQEEELAEQAESQEEVEEEMLMEEEGVEEGEWDTSSGSSSGGSEDQEE